MDLRKLPPSMVLALGLACGHTGSSDTGSNDTGSNDTGSNDNGGSGTTVSTVSDTSTISSCLDIDPHTSDTTASPPDTTGMTGDVSTGPCLSPPLETTGTDSGSGSETGTDTEGTTGTTGMMVGPSASRSSAVERVLERGTLPTDVADRLRRTLDRPQTED